MSIGKPTGGGIADGAGAGGLFVENAKLLKSNAANKVKILFGAIFILRKSKKKY